MYLLSINDKQEIFKKKMIVEADSALLPLKKDSEIVKESKWHDDGAGLHWLKRGRIWAEKPKDGIEMTWAEMIRVRNCLSLVREIVIPLELSIVKQTLDNLS